MKHAVTVSALLCNRSEFIVFASLQVVAQPTPVNDWWQLTRMPPKQAQVKGVGASSSPGGTKTIDFKIGGAYGGDLGGGFQPNGSEDEAQAALLDDLLASAEDEHFRRDDDVQVKQPQQQKHSITSSSRNSHNTPTSRNPSQQRQGGPLPDSHGEKASGLKPSALAAKYGVDYDGVDSDSDDDFGPDDDVNVGSSAAGGGAGVGAKAGANPSASEFGPLAAAAQENLTLKAELDERRQQVKKLGVMLECLAPVPGLDAEKLLDVMEGTYGKWALLAASYSPEVDPHW